ncbi:hypothetical protein R8Z50_11885 [Longispora sp. K20-0274]|uniref:hypothetical protein n=1 Tax=Longispora sp. K20-0274 TaxID=3088255 RepID=UPI00399A5EE1
MLTDDRAADAAGADPGTPAAYFPELDQMDVAAHYVEALGGRWTQIPGGLGDRFATAGMSPHYAGNRLQRTGPSMA